MGAGVTTDAAWLDALWWGVMRAGTGIPGWRPSAVRLGGRDCDAGLPRSPWVWNPARVTVRLMAMRAMTAAVMVTLAIATGCTVQGGQPARATPAVSVICRASAHAISDSAAFDAAHPGASPRPVLTMPHLVATRPAPVYSPGAPPDQVISLFADPDDARDVFRLGSHGLSLIDAARWAVRWTTAIPVPRSFGAAGLSDLTPRFFHGYTEIVAGSPPYSVDAVPTTGLPDQVVTAVDTRGKVLQSCTIRPAAQDPVLLPRAGIVLLPGDPGQLAPGLVAYSTATGARLWQAPGALSVTSADTVYVSTVAPQPGVAAYDAASGRRLWADQLQGVTLITDLAVINGTVYAERPDATPDHIGDVIALRARDGRQLWQRPWTPADVGPEGPQIVGVDAATVLFLPPTANPHPALRVAQLISVTGGLLLSEVSIGSYGNNDPWRSWPALLGQHHAIVVAQGSGPAFTLTTAPGYPSTVDSGVGGGPAAVASNVAYFLTAGSCPPDPPSVTAVDLRTGQSLWSVLVPQIPCTDLGQAASLLAYDNGFAVRTSTGQLLLYQ